MDPTFAVLLLMSALVSAGAALTVRAFLRSRRPAPAGTLERLGGRPVPGDGDPSQGTGQRRLAEDLLAASGEHTAVGVVLVEILAEDPSSCAGADGPATEGVVEKIGAAAGPGARVYRFASGVFCVVLSGAGPEAARETAQGIRWATLAEVAGWEPPVEVLVGVAAVRRAPLRALHLADAALYEAKMRGEDGLVVAEVPLELRSG